MHTRKRLLTWMGMAMALLLLGCPRPARLPQKADVGGLMMYDYQGLQVLHQYADRPLIHIRLHFDWLGLEEADFVTQNLAVEAAFSCGAGDDGPTAFARKLESAGATFEFLRTTDGPVMLINCLPDRLKATWELIDACLTAPRFDSKSFQQLRSQRLSQYKARAEDHMQQALEACWLAAFPRQAHPLFGASSPAGVSTIGAQSVFQDLLRRPCNLRLLVAGPIEAEQISDLLYETIEGLPDDPCSPRVPASMDMQIGKEQLVLAAKGQQAVVGFFPSPLPSSLEGLEMRLVMHMIAQRLQQHLVQRDRVASRVEARYVAESPSYNLLQMSCSNAYKCAEFTLSELRQLKSTGFDAQEVAGAKAALKSQILLGYESAAGLCARLDAQASAGTASLAGHETRILERADAKSCNALLDQYLVGITWGIVGDTTGLDRKSLHRL